MGNFLDDNAPSEYEQLAETFEEQSEALLEEIENDEFEEEYEDDTAYSLNSHESEVVSDATIRLEQARLYDMLIKHDLFEGVEVHPQALANVKKEIKEYIVSRLEVLLGMRSDVKEEQEEKHIVVESDFNELEIEALKSIAYKLTKGESAGLPRKKVVANEVDVETPSREGLNPISQKPKREGLKTLKPQKVAKVEVKEKPKKKATPTAKKPAKKVASKPTKKVAKKAAAPKKTKSITRKRRGEMTNAEAEEIAREELAKNGKGLTKSPYQMTAKELAKLAKEKAKGSKKPKKRPAGAAPMPTSDQLEMMYNTQQLNSGIGANTEQRIVNALVKNAVKKANS